MPFLRFSRDRRGYESTFLLQSARRRGDQDRARLLYWFRSPPHVKLGRAAFDEDAIRGLEEQHPDVEFDWARILTAKPPAAPPAEPVRLPRRVRRGEPPPVPFRPPEVKRPVPVFPADGQDHVVALPVPDEPDSVAGPELPAEPPDAPPARRFVRVYDAPEPQAPAAEADVSEAEGEGGDERVEPHHLSDPSAVERELGSDRLNRLRGQYAAVLARIGTRVSDPVLAEKLRAVAERANPDAWVTSGDVASGLAGLDTVYEELARHVGRRRRRRRGRGAGSREARAVEGSGSDQAGPPEVEDFDAPDGEEPEPE